MVPAVLVSLDRLPLNASGKVDRAALQKIAGSMALSTARPAVAEVAGLPQNQLERDLATIWQQVLGLERVSVHDNFFDLGGHSLLMAQAHSRLQEHLGREVPIVDLFRYPTIHLLASHLTGRAEVGAPPSAAQQGQERGQQKRDALNAQRERIAQRGRITPRTIQANRETPPRKGGR
jgi:acyl carrier protein